MLGSIRDNAGPDPHYACHRGSDYVPYQYKNRRSTRGDDALAALAFHQNYLSAILVSSDCVDWQRMDSSSREDRGIAPQADLYNMAGTMGGFATFDRDSFIKRLARVDKSFIDRASSEGKRLPKNRIALFTYYVDLADQPICDRDLKYEVIGRIYGCRIDEATSGWNRSLSKPAERDCLLDVADKDECDLVAEVRRFHAEALSFIEEVLSGATGWVGDLAQVRSVVLGKWDCFLEKAGMEAYRSTARASVLT